MLLMRDVHKSNLARICHTVFAFTLSLRPYNADSMYMSGQSILCGMPFEVYCQLYFGKHSTMCELA